MCHIYPFRHICFAIIYRNPYKHSYIVYRIGRKDVCVCVYMCVHIYLCTSKTIIPIFLIKDIE